MKPHPDHPDLTAYALGEPHSTSVAEWAENHADVSAIQDLALHLQATAAIPDAKLHPHQRSFILNPRSQASSHYKYKASRPRLLWSTLFKGGVAAALVAGSFIAGRQISQPLTTVTSTTSANQSTPLVVASPPVFAGPATPKKSTQETSDDAAAKKQTQPIAASQPKAEPAVVPQAVIATAGTKTVPTSKLKIMSNALVSTTEQTIDRSTLSMKELRLVKPRPRGETAASPVRSTTKKLETDPKPEKPAELLLHSWSAQVFSCPWKPESRLIRVQIQLPSTQLRKEDGALSVNFDPNAVRYYRYLGRRSTPGIDEQSPAHVSLWYEVQTNGSLGTAEVPRLLGSLTAQNARFTTAAKQTNLSIVDVGQTELKDQQCLETALLGFGLLMHGAEKSPLLQPKTLLQLAQKAQQLPDPTKELKRLIRTLRESEQLTYTDP